jgi:two-component system sensor histidine kinase YesM
MVLQPIVENAILHGVMEQDSVGGDIRISARRVDEGILVTVSDNGVGMDEETIRKVLRGNESKGYGLSSVSERMRLYYKRRYGMKIRSAVGEGTTVEVLFPVCRTDPSIR